MMDFKVIILFCFVNVILSSPFDKSAKVIGGIEVDASTKFPYQTANFARFSSGSVFCSGSILSRKTVITCAHCLVGSNNVSIYFGSENLSALDFSRNQIVSSENYQIHPNYASLVNDVALIVLNHQLMFNGEIYFSTNMNFCN